MVRSENFSFGFIKDMSKFIILRENCGKVRNKLHKMCECYESMLKGLSKEATLVLSNTRELNRVPNTR